MMGTTMTIGQRVAEAAAAIRKAVADAGHKAVQEKHEWGATEFVDGWACSWSVFEKRSGSGWHRYGTGRLQCTVGAYGRRKTFHETKAKDGTIRPLDYAAIAARLIEESLLVAKDEVDESARQNRRNVSRRVGAELRKQYGLSDSVLDDDDDGELVLRTEFQGEEAIRKALAALRAAGML